MFSARTPRIVVNPRYVEMNRPFRSEPDRGVAMERAMAVTVFRDLQNAGLIDRNARLSDRPPADGAGLSGTSYEGRLVELIRDQNGNGRLDIDVNALRDSGMLRGSPTAAQVESAISGAPRQEVSDRFLRRQTESSLFDKGSDLTTDGEINSRGREVQRHSSGMVLQTDTEARARTSPEEARRVADEAIAGAQFLETQRDPAAARETLSRAGDGLMRAGRLDDAERVYRELQREPHASAEVNLMQSEIDARSRSSSSFDPRRHVLQFDNQGTDTQVTPRNFRSTYGELAGRRLDQIAQTREMQGVVGSSADPHNLDHARQYFQSYARTHSTEQVAQEYQRYQQNFYAHSGNNGVTWRSDIPQDDRPRRAQELFDGQPADASGRRIIDCEGYTYMADHIFRDLPGADGRPMFAVSHGGTDTHVIAGVSGRDGRSFIVNNDHATMTPPGSPISRSLGDDLAGNHIRVIGIGNTPSAANAVEEGTGRPLPGRFVWNGSQGPAEVVGPGFISDWERAQRDPTIAYAPGELIPLGGGVDADRIAAWRLREGRVE